VSPCSGSFVRRAVALGAWLACSHAAASPNIDFGFGARSQALAGAGVATADDAAGVFQNPSGIVRADHVIVNAGFSSVSYALDVSGVDANLPSVQTLDAGLVVPGKIFHVPVAFGFAFSLPDGQLSRLREPQPSEPYWSLDDPAPRLVDVGSTFALSPFPGLLLGGGIGFQASLRGNFRVQGTAVAADGSGSEYQSDLRHAVDADLAASRFPLFGASYLPSERLAFGLAYRGASLIEHHIAGVLDGTLEVGENGVPVRYAFRTDANVAYIPAQVAFGASVRPLARLLVTAELDWQRYSAYRSPYPETSTHTELPPDSLVVPDTEAVPAPPAHFTDRYVPRIGVEPSVELAPSLLLEFRAGYSYQASPVPRSQPATRLLALDRHVLSLGAGATWQNPVTAVHAVKLDLVFADAFGVAETLSTTAGTNADHLSGQVLLFGASLGVAFQGQ
jgi:long-chain fatty acid transport protein